MQIMEYTDEELQEVSKALLRAATAEKPDISAIKFIVEHKNNEDNKVDEILELLTREATQRRVENE